MKKVLFVNTLITLKALSLRNVYGLHILLLLDHFPHARNKMMSTSPHKNIFWPALTAIRWIEAFPLVEIIAASVAIAFFSSWISEFGVPLHVITDKGTQLQSKLLTELPSLVGLHRLYHTGGIATNGLFYFARKKNQQHTLPELLNYWLYYCSTYRASQPLPFPP